MPWKAKAASSKTKKASTPAKRRKWARVANSILKQSGSEGKAIRIANAMMRRKTKAA